MIRGLMVLLVALSMASLVGCVEELDGNGSTSQGYCSNADVEGENAACSSDADCNDGLRCYSENGDKFCVVACSDDGDCGTGTCNTGDSNNGDANNGDANNGDANNGDTNNGDTNNGDANNGDANNGTNNGANNGANNGGDANASCQAACANFEGCTTDFCGIQILDVNACTQACLEDPVEFQADAIAVASCDQLAPSVCQVPEVAGVCQGCGGGGDVGTTEDCAPACEMLDTCSQQICTQAIFDVTACTNACVANPGQFQPGQVLARSCDELNAALCQEPNLPPVCTCQ